MWNKVFLLVIRLLSFPLNLALFIDAVAKLWKTSICSFMSVRSSPWNSLSYSGRIFLKFDTKRFLIIYLENSSFIKL